MNRDRSAETTTPASIAQDLERAVARAAEAGQHYAIVAAAPQHLPGERRSEIVRALADRLPEIVRSTDLAGMVDGEVLIVAAENDHVSAAVLADRLQSELRLRTLHLQNISWESGFACLPDDGTTADELLTRAIAETQTRRRRLATL